MPDYLGEPRLWLFDGPVAVAAYSVALDWRDPGRRKLGKLHFLGGVRLVSAAPAFGRFSAMTILGDRFTLLSDGSNIVSFRLDSRRRDSRRRDKWIARGGIAEWPGARLEQVRPRQRITGARSGDRAAMGGVRGGGMRSGARRCGAGPIMAGWKRWCSCGEGKATILWITSDDNRLSLQRSLLLKFRLED